MNYVAHAMIGMTFVFSAPALIASEQPGSWSSYGGLRNGCDQSDSIEEAITLPDGDILAIGNITQCVDSNIPNDLARFDIQSGQWSSVPGFVSASAQNRLFRVGSRVFVASANNSNRVVAAGLPASWILEWDASTGIWSIPNGGVNGGIQAMATDNQFLYVGGGFTQAGGVAAARIARFNLSTGAWTPLGQGANGSVRAIAISADYIYVGGTFSQVDGINAGRIARMHRINGVWTDLNGGNTTANSSVDTLALQGPDLYAGGVFTSMGSITSNQVARWNEASQTWNRVGIEGVFSNSSVYRLLAHPTGLYATAGALGSWLARWNPIPPPPPSTAPGSWVSVGAASRFSTTPANLGAHVAGADIFVFGNMWAVNGQRFNGIARFDTANTTFNALGSGQSNAVTRAEGSDLDRIRMLEVSGGRLIAGGLFEEIGGVPSFGFAAWDGAAWTDLSGPASVGRANALLNINGQAIVAGTWPQDGINQNIALCQLNAVTCVSLGGGADGNVATLARVGDIVYAGGDFARVSNPSINTPRLAKYTLGSGQWSGFGTGVTGSSVNALASIGADLYVGGNFTAIDGVVFNDIARLDTTTGMWFSLGSGIANQSGGSYVNALAVLNGNLYVGGRFSSVGGIAVRNIAVWSPGTGQWSALGGGIDDTNGVISLLADGHRVYAGGFFDLANGPVNSGGIPAPLIASWDTGLGRWNSLNGQGLTSRSLFPRVGAMTIFNGQLVVGGSFTDAAGQASRHIAAFAPTSIYSNGFE